jgi:hypothetical protein
MTLLIILATIGVAFFLLDTNDRRRTRARKAIQDMEYAKEKIQQANEQKVKELEAEIFGIGIEIRELPGCIWSVTRGCEHMVRDETRVDENGLSVLLLDADSNTLQERAVLSIRYETIDSGHYSGYPRRGRYVSMTVEELEEKLQDAMKSMVKKEMEKRKYEAGFAQILEKYNGKAVEVE